MVNSAIWNEIAKTQKLKTSWARKTFNLDQEEMIENHSKECKILRNRDFDPDVILSFLEVKPLLLENVAISNYVMMKGDPDLRQALPEVCTVNEAVVLGTMENRLNPSQQEQLKELLDSILTSEKQPIDFQQLGQDFFRCYFGDKPTVTVADIAKVLGVGDRKGSERKWEIMFRTMIEVGILPCVKEKGYVRANSNTLAVWFQFESERRQ